MYIKLNLPKIQIKKITKPVCLLKTKHTGSAKNWVKNYL